jgi:hypothetical protein
MFAHVITIHSNNMAFLSRSLYSLEQTTSTNVAINKLAEQVGLLH